MTTQTDTALPPHLDRHAIRFDYLSQEHLLRAGCLDFRMALETTERTLVDHHSEQVLHPNKIVQIFDEGTQERINCLPATLLAEKICGAKWVSVFPANVDRFDRQSLTAVFILSEIEKGYPIAFMEGTLASNLRVAAIGALAARYLAPKEPRIIGFIGSGEQAKMHFLAMKTLFPTLEECRVSSKTAIEEERFIEQLQPIEPNVRFVQAYTDGEAAVADADILVTATSAQAPLLKAAWMKPGSFYSHIGGWEDEYDVARQCDKIVCDDWDTVKRRTQTLSRMFQEGELTDDDIHADLEDLVVGTKPGRERDDERIYFNAVGLSYVDVAIALAMYRRAVEHGYREELTLQSTTIFEHPTISEWIRM